MNKISLSFLPALCCSICIAQPSPYPETKKWDQKDTYFNTAVEDPYRWLEDDNSAETATWVKRQNVVTEDYLSKIPFRDKLKQRLTQLWNYPKQTVPSKQGSYYFFYKNDGIQNQNVLNIQKDLSSPPAVFLDPNMFSKDGTTSLSGTSISNNSKYFAYSISKGGSDWNEICVREIRTSSNLKDTLKWVKFSGISWQKNGFYYSSYGAPEPGNELKKKNEFHKIYYHELNTPQSADKLIYEDKNQPQRNFGAGVTDDERFLYIAGSQGTSGNDLVVKNLNMPGSDFIRIVTGFDNDFDVLDNSGESLIIQTNHAARNGKVILVDTKNPGKENWKDLIPERDGDVLQGITVASDKLIVRYMKDAVNYLEIFDRNGRSEKIIKPDILGTIENVSGHRNDSLVFYSITSFVYPSVVYMYNINSKKISEHYKPKINFDLDNYETRQVWYNGKDGTRIPMFIVHKKGIVLDGNNPTFLYGYGGFNISMNPSFAVWRLAFLELGGIYVSANIRGGGEYGEAWHKAGTKLQKQNVFDDFIAAAEYLINSKYTNPSKLAIHGRSNGGLLVGACMTQRPDLFKVALPAVGVLDMLRYHKFTIGWAWAVDYGSSENKDEFEALYRYSPLHNIKSGTNYPATLVTTADHDDRVVPAHSFKFISELQRKQSGDNPVLIRIDVMAGHGAGKPTSKLIDEWADILSFTMFNLGVSVN